MCCGRIKPDENKVKKRREKQLIEERETERKVEVEICNWVTSGNCSQTFTCATAAKKPQTKEYVDFLL